MDRDRQGNLQGVWEEEFLDEEFSSCPQDFEQYRLPSTVLNPVWAHRLTEHLEITVAIAY